MNPVHGRTASKLKFLKPDFIPLHAFLILISSFLSPLCCCGLNARSRSILTWKKLILKPEMYTSDISFSIIWKWTVQLDCKISWIVPRNFLQIVCRNIF